MWHVPHISFCLLLFFVSWVVLVGFRKAKNIWKYLTLFVQNESSVVSVRQWEGPKYVPKDVPVLVAKQSNLTSLDNSYDALKKVRPSFAGCKKCGVKPGSIIKSDKTHEDMYLACEAYWKLLSQDIKMKSSSFLNSSHCDSCCTDTKIEEQSFGHFLVYFDNVQLESSAVMRGRSSKYV